jgi:hypothetical protein
MSELCNKSNREIPLMDKLPEMFCAKEKGHQSNCFFVNPKAAWAQKVGDPGCTPGIELGAFRKPVPPEAKN